MACFSYMLYILPITNPPRSTIEPIEPSRFGRFPTQRGDGLGNVMPKAKHRITANGRCQRQRNTDEAPGQGWLVEPQLQILADGGEASTSKDGDDFGKTGMILA